MLLKALHKTISLLRIIRSGPFRTGSSICVAIILLLSGSHSTAQELRFSLDRSKIRYYDFYHSPPVYGLSITQRRQPLLSNKLKISRKVEFQSDGKWVKLDYTEGGYRLYQPLYIPADKYTAQKSIYDLNKAWKDELYQAQLKEEESKEGGLLEYEIPIKFPKMVRSIIGEGGPGLKVNGYRRITFSGKSSWDSGVKSTAAYKQSKFPTLNMEQESKFNITGTIGSKITVKVDQDSKAMSDLENRIHIKYTGEEDEIITSIEAGNTNLSLPNTQFVGYSQNVQGLFGIKAEAQIGNLDLTVITSQEKGSTEKTSFSAGAQGSEEVIRDFEYLKRTYFWLDYSFTDLVPGDSIVDLKLYVSTLEKEQPRALVVVDPEGQIPPPQDQIDRDEVEYTYFKLMDPTETGMSYTLYPKQHYIRLDNRLGYNENTLAAYMVVEHTDGTRDTIGNLDYVRPPADPDTSYILKLIWKDGADSSFTTWNNEMRNVYSLRSSKIDPDGFELNIYRGVRGAENPATDSSEYHGVPLIQVLGLDSTNLDGQLSPDNLVDESRVNFYYGHLIFPNSRPFDIGALDAGDRVPQIYDLDNETDIQEASKYYIQVKTSNRATTFSLGHSNIIEGSEVVKLNGRTLRKGKDYNIYYEIGQVTFLTDEATDPNANITIDYEYAPFFMPERKSLFGTRLVYNFGENNWIGSTALYKSETTADQKPRVGSEPRRNFVWDTDLSLTFEPQFMTDMVNALPLVETESQSNLNIQAEFAQSIPNPNTKGEAFIDDFESSREYYDLSIFRGPWTLASRPVEVDDQARRAAMRWYNPYHQVRITEIWPNREVKESENRTNILQIEYIPDQQDSAASWAGLMKTMPAGLADQSRTKFIELWMKKVTDANLEMHIDLGVISEDINGNGILDSEDRLKNGIRDGILDDDEDTGLDGIFGGPAENDTNRFIESGFIATASDPHGDNWDYSNRDDYRFINGTENNREDPDRGRRPDTEDINENGNLDNLNSYFSFSFNLDDPQVIADSTIRDGKPTGWKLYRIPLEDISSSTGSAKWNQIEFARFWFTGADTNIVLQIAQFQLVGNKWQVMSINAPDTTVPVGPDEKFDVTVKNSQENSDYYPPPGITIEVDPTSNLKRKEQSLVLQFENIEPGHSASAYRVLYSAEDYSNYEKMNMWVFGRGNFQPEEMKFFFRMGIDTISNYYEFNTPVEQGWALSNEMAIDFPEITRLKNEMQTAGDSMIAEGHYAVRGEPSLTRVLWFVVGIEASDSAAGPMSGEIWINELRVTDPRDNADWAGRLAVSTKFADLLDVSASYQRMGADFYNLLQKKGSGSITTSKSMRGSLSFHKFFPPSWGLNLPVSASWANTVSLPRLKPGSDIILPQELRDAERTENTSTTFDIRESMRMKTDNWLIGATLNRLSGSYSTSYSNSRSPSVPKSTQERWTAKGKYDLSLGGGYSLPLFGWTKNLFLLNKTSKWDFTYLPSTLVFDANVTSLRRNSLSISGTRTDVYNRDLTLNGNTTYQPFSTMTYNFNFTSLRDIRDGRQFNLSLNPRDIKLGQEVDYNQRFDGSWRPKFVKFIDTRFSYNSDYHQNSDPQQQRDSTISVDNGNSVSFEGALNWQKLFGPSQKFGGQKGPKGKLPVPGKDDELGEGEEEEEEEERGPMPGSPVWLWNRFRGMLSTLDPLRLNFTRQKSFAKSGLLGDPSFLYKFGLEEDPGVEEKVVENLGQSDSKSMTDSYTLRSGVSPFTSLNLDLSYTRRVTTTRSSTEPTRDNSTTFPDIDISLTGLERVGFLRKIASSSSVTSGYSVKKDTKENPDTGELTNKTVRKSWSPLFSWSLNWKNGVRTTLKMDNSKTQQEDLRSIGSGGNTTRSLSSSISLTLNYSFRAPKGIKLPFLNRIKFDSNLNLGITITKRQDKSETSKQGLPFNTDSDKHNFSFNANASYSFSKQISGGLKIGWTDSDDKKLKKKQHTRELAIWAEIHF
jgi:cell surface protein SprA